MAYTKIAVSGATGNLGPSVVEALVKAGLDVTVLSQSGNTKALPSQVKVKKVDYSSQESLVEALQGHEAYVSVIPDHGSQPALIDAAIAAGVKLFIPSEFGANIAGNAKTAALPVFAGKKKTQDYLAQKKEQIDYTIVVNGPFLDWCLKVGFVMNVKGGPTTVFDDGNSKFSATTLADIGQAIVGILKNPEQTKNRPVYVQTALVSQNQILDIARKLKPDLNIEEQHESAIDLEKKSYELLQKGGESIGPAMGGFVQVSVVNNEYGSNWADKNDNALLGVKEASPEELEQFVASAL